MFDNVNLPAVVNENAVQTLLLNQDRWEGHCYACFGAIIRLP